MLSVLKFMHLGACRIHPKLFSVTCGLCVPGGMANAPFLPQVIDLKGNELGGSSGGRDARS